MIPPRFPLCNLLAPITSLFLLSAAHAAIQPAKPAAKPAAPIAVKPADTKPKHWLFFWRNMSDPKDVDRTIAQFPKAQADGYNGVVLGSNVAPEKAAELKAAAKKYGLDIIALVMGGTSDRNYMEGVQSKDALFVAHNGAAALVPDNPTKVVNGDFEDSTGNHLKGWTFQDDEGVTTFVDHDIKHGGNASLRMENIAKNDANHCRAIQPLKLQPHRQYRISFWLKTENLAPSTPEVKILFNGEEQVSFQTFHAAATQDWTHYDLTFNSLNYSDVNLYIGSWWGKDGKMWWDDFSIDEIGLMNLLRRPGCPVTVRGENGTTYEEGKDFEKIVDPKLHPWQGYHEPPLIKLTPTSRIAEGDKLRVSYYHSIIVYDDRVNTCLSEPKIFDDWRDEVNKVNDLLHPAAFFMQHDELRVMNQCALCQSKNMTAGQLLAWNIRKSAQIIRDIRPDAGIWVWSDMFDPNHNAVDHYFAVNGTLKGSWEGLDKDVGIVNWNGGGLDKTCRFFAGLGLRQVLSGYYDGDEDGSGIVKWMDSAKGIPGIQGAMYTTWEDKYGAMDTWAQKAWGGAMGEVTAGP